MQPALDQEFRNEQYESIELLAAGHRHAVAAVALAGSGALPLPLLRPGLPKVSDGVTETLFKVHAAITVASWNRPEVSF